MKRNERLFIEDILENIELILKSIKGLSKEKFESDRLLIDATIRRVEIIGEAVKNISEKTKKKHPKIEWRKIAGSRDIFIHAYFGVNLDKVWNIVKNDLPILKKEVSKIKLE